MKDKCQGCGDFKEIEDWGKSQKDAIPTGYCGECVERIKRGVGRMRGEEANKLILRTIWFDPPAFWKNILRMRKTDIAMRRA